MPSDIRMRNSFCSRGSTKLPSVDDGQLQQQGAAVGDRAVGERRQPLDLGVLVGGQQRVEQRVLAGEVVVEGAFADADRGRRRRGGWCRKSPLSAKRSSAASRMAWRVRWPSAFLGRAIEINGRSFNCVCQTRPLGAGGCRRAVARADRPHMNRALTRELSYHFNSRGSLMQERRRSAWIGGMVVVRGTWSRRRISSSTDRCTAPSSSAITT